MTIFLFTDFGSADLYVGQLKSVLHEHAPGVRVIDLLHEAPAFNIKAGAHLLAALSGELPAESVLVAVVDPGVGSARSPVMMHADERWYVGPDNGLLSVVGARARTLRVFPVAWRPGRMSASFHGRDLFAPLAGRIATGALRAERLEAKPRLDVEFGADDLAEIIYIDHYGNAFTGLRAKHMPQGASVVIGRRRAGYARRFSDVPPGEIFWYENSLGLVEISANTASAAARLGLRIGQPFQVATT